MDYSSKQQILFKELRKSAKRPNASISSFLDAALTTISRHSEFKKINLSVILISGSCREGKKKEKENYSYPK